MATMRMGRRIRRQGAEKVDGAIRYAVTRLQARSSATSPGTKAKEMASTPVQPRHRHPGLLLRPPQPLATALEEEHQQALAPVSAEGTDLSLVTEDELAAIARGLNNRPQ